MKCGRPQLTLFWLGLCAWGLWGFLPGCRGYSSEKPPVHPNPNMDTQEKYKPYRESDYFADKRTMREPVPDTVALGQLREDDFFYRGLIDGQPAKGFPAQVKLDESFLERGKIMYGRMCSACHSAVGDGKGLVGQKLLVPPTSLHESRVRDLPPGHFFQVISNGIRTMQGYGHMISEEDRWAIVAYIRVLQESQDADGEWIKGSASWWKQK